MKFLLQASDELESKITPHATAPFLALATPQASSTSATRNQPNPLPLTSCLCQAPPIGLCCQKHHCGSTELYHCSTEIRAMLLTNQIEIFRIGTF